MTPKFQLGLTSPTNSERERFLCQSLWFDEFAEWFVQSWNCFGALVVFVLSKMAFLRNFSISQFYPRQFLASIPVQFCSSFFSLSSLTFIGMRGEQSNGPEGPVNATNASKLFRIAGSDARFRLDGVDSRRIEPQRRLLDPNGISFSYFLAYSSPWSARVHYQMSADYQPDSSKYDSSSNLLCREPNESESRRRLGISC